MKGKVKWFNKNKGFGFIVGEDEKEYFVHWQSIKSEGYKSLIDNEEVEFEIKDSDKGVQAVDVVKVNQ